MVYKLCTYTVSFARVIFLCADHKPYECILTAYQKNVYITVFFTNNRPNHKLCDIVTAVTVMKLMNFLCIDLFTYLAN